MRLTSIIALFLANLAVATPIEEISNNVASEADIARCSRRYDICIKFSTSCELVKKRSYRDLI
ncbi:uncharacterized protein N7503_011620 [Penicillium pulvis]|uniref:uncharacterized protein n=1 Tax=Penicillium pulvis TaxID=1562058 RepID=UPI0025486D54|nr:uncharacterized protein N7503_011620 [Penicillium pulvis]KAJ5786408.1 hypothetical protein N7503_011620 [Penicillium pulvis]